MSTLLTFGDLSGDGIDQFLDSFRLLLSPLHQDIVFGFFLHRPGYTFRRNDIGKKHKLRYNTFNKESAEALGTLRKALKRMGINKLKDLPIDEPHESNVKGKPKYTKPPYQGVWLAEGKYRARMIQKRVKYDLGLYDTPEQAGEAWSRKFIELNPKCRIPSGAYQIDRATAAKS
jgi:hypothetical protein